MMKHRLAATLASSAIAAATITACGAPQQDPRPPKPGAWPEITAYIKAHPTPPQKGMLVGILVRSERSGYACLNVVCHKWEGTLVEADGNTDQIIDEGEVAGARNTVFPGDYLYFPEDGALVGPGDVQVIRHAAVKIS